MHRIVVYIAFGWLTLGGALHFAIDVFAQYLRDKRVPGPETTLYYGLNTAHALSQLLFGIGGLLVAQRALDAVEGPAALLLCVVAAAAWLAFGFVFIEYQQPKIVAGIFGALVLAMAFTKR